MKVYTAKAVAAFLGISDRRVRQLKQEGIIQEYKPGSGLYNLKDTTQAYIAYLKAGTAGDQLDYTTEKAKLMRAKRESEELELRNRKRELHESAEIEMLIGTMLVNFRSKLMSIPAKLAPIMAVKTDKAEIFKIIKEAVDEALNELSDYKNVFEIEEEPEEEQEEAEKQKETQ